jgi:hypothetical protein
MVRVRRALLIISLVMACVFHIWNAGRMNALTLSNTMGGGYAICMKCVEQGAQCEQEIPYLCAQGTQGSIVSLCTDKAKDKRCQTGENYKKTDSCENKESHICMKGDRFACVKNGDLYTWEKLAVGFESQCQGTGYEGSGGVRQCHYKEEEGL